jgi:hypothetical protein
VSSQSRPLDGVGSRLTPGGYAQLLDWAAGLGGTAGCPGSPNTLDAENATRAVLAGHGAAVPSQLGAAPITLHDVWRTTTTTCSTASLDRYESVILLTASSVARRVQEGGTFAMGLAPSTRSE